MRGRSLLGSVLGGGGGRPWALPRPGHRCGDLPGVLVALGAVGDLLATTTVGNLLVGGSATTPQLRCLPPADGVRLPSQGDHPPWGRGWAASPASNGNCSRGALRASPRLAGAWLHDRCLRGWPSRAETLHDPLGWRDLEKKLFGRSTCASPLPRCALPRTEWASSRQSCEGRGRSSRGLATLIYVLMLAGWATLSTGADAGEALPGFFRYFG